MTARIAPMRWFDHQAGEAAYFRFTEAVSLVVDCANPQEVDHDWERLRPGASRVRGGLTDQW